MNLIETRSGTYRIDRERSPLSHDVVNTFKKRFERTVSISSRDELAAKLNELFPLYKEKAIKDFFNAHPTRWFDLIRKLNKYRKNDSQHGWYIEANAIEDIYTTFLVSRSEDTVGDKLKSLLPDVITKNQALLEFASTQPSVLDSGGYEFSKIPSSKRKHLIKNLICSGFAKNIHGCNYHNIEDYFEDIFKSILEYLKQIFGIMIPIHVQDVTQLVKTIDIMLQSSRGYERENGFQLIQAIHAWAGIDYIRELNKTAQSEIQKLPSILKGIGIKVGTIKIAHHDDTIVYSSTFEYNSKIYDIHWRAKSVKSILQKQWESEEYTNADAMRDIVAVSIVYPDDEECTEVIEITSKICTIMPNFGYILKDKNNLGEGALQEVKKRAEQKKKSPAYISYKRGSSTNPKFKSTSISGFIRFSKGLSLGSEFQILSKSSYQWKKEDDKKYKPRSAIEALIRGKKFAGITELIDLLDVRIQPSGLQSLGFTSLNEIIIEMILDEFLIPYISKDPMIILFTTKDQEYKFAESFPNMKKCDIHHSRYTFILDLIRHYTTRTLSFSPTQENFLLQFSQDQ